jgi:hypothetical protein
MKKNVGALLINHTKTSGKTCGKAADLLGNHASLTCVKACGILVENRRKAGGRGAEKPL